MPRQLVRTLSSVDGDGTQLVEEEWCDAPGWPAVTLPTHPGDTRCEVLGGVVRVRIGATERAYRPGESVIVAPGQAASLLPVDDEGVHLLVQRWSRRPGPGDR